LDTIHQSKSNKKATDLEKSLKQQQTMLKKAI